MTQLARLQETLDVIRDEMPERYMPRRESEQRFAQHEDLIAQVTRTLAETVNVVQQIKLALPTEYTQRADFQVLIERVNTLEKDLSATITAAIADQLAQERNKHVRLSDRSWAVVMIGLGWLATIIADKVFH